MAHRLLVPPVRRMQGTARLPVVQDLEAATRRWWATFQTRDALRKVGTSRALIAPGPLPTPQSFVMNAAGGPNSAENMQGGLRISNAPALVDASSGAGAGIGGGQRASAASNAMTGGGQ